MTVGIIMQKNFKFDAILFSGVTILAAISLLIIYSFSSGENNYLGIAFFYKQLTAVVIGLLGMLFFAIYDYRVFLKFSSWLYFFAILLLVWVMLFGENIRGTTGWINFGLFNFQPVELVKVILIIFLASFFTKKKREFGVKTRIIASLVLIAIPVFLILKQPDLGSALIIIFVWLGMTLASKIGKKNVLFIILLGILVSFMGAYLLKDYQTERLRNFVDPFRDPKGSGYNVIQSMIAIGSGGVWGKGLGHGSQSQLNFLPEKHTDFIFAALAEELGFLGSAFVLGIFILIFYRLKEIARHSRDNFGYLIVVGTMVLVFSQSFINIGMNMGIAPVTGVPLPFLSYGGSAIISIFMLFVVFGAMTISQGKYATSPSIIFRSKFGYPSVASAG